MGIRTASWLLAFGLLANGCVIIHETDSSTPASRPRHHAQARPKKAPPKKKSKPKKQSAPPKSVPPKSAPPPASPPPSKPVDPPSVAPPTGDGRIVVAVVGGSCDVAIDGKSYGDTMGYTAVVPVGNHTVTCTPSGGPTYREEVTVRDRDRPVAVTFTINKSSSKQTSKKPPISRPTP